MLGTNARHELRGSPPGSTSTPQRSRRTRRAVVALSATATLTLGSLVSAGPASAAPAGDDPVGGLLGGITKTVHDVLTPKKTTPPKKSSGSSSSGHTSSGSSNHASSGSSSSGSRSSGSTSSRSSTSTNHATGSVGKVAAGKKPLLGLSNGSSKAGKKTASADATLLALGGVTLIGSHADSAGDQTGSGPVPQIPLCDVTGGALCLDLLFADSAATSDGPGSDASTHTGVAGVCLGGDDKTGAGCSGVHVGVAESSSHVHKDGKGNNDSTSSGSLVNACAQDDDSCAVAGEVLGSSSASGSHAGAAEKPSLASLLLGDYAIAGPDDPINTDITKDCTTNVLCTTLNDKSSDGTASDSGSAATGSGLGDNLGLDLGHSDTGSSAGQGATTPPTGGTGTGKQGGSASGVLADLGLTSQQLLGLSENKSAGDLDRTTGDATLLSLLGTELIGSHAASDGETESHGPIPDNPLCASSGGALCIDPLYADSAASKDAQGSDASTRTGVAAICLGGHDPSGTSCDGIEAGVAQGSSYLHNDKASGITDAGSATSLANLCLHGDTQCTLSAQALASSGSADSKGNKTQDSSIADLGLDGTQAGAPADPIDVSVPTTCPTDNLTCIFLNQVAAGANDGSTTAGTTVVGVGVIGDTIGATAAQTEVTANGGAPEVEPPTTNPPGTDPPSTNPPGTNPPSTGSSTGGSTSGAAAANTSGGLPNTGGVGAGVLGLGLLLVGVGAGALARSRRRIAA